VSFINFKINIKMDQMDQTGRRPNTEQRCSGLENGIFESVLWDELGYLGTKLTVQVGQLLL
jgi:hypothetical protein